MLDSSQWASSVVGLMSYRESIRWNLLITYLVIQLLFDVLPDFTVLEEWIQLYHLHDLLFCSAELVKIKSCAVECWENGSTQVVSFDKFWKYTTYVRLVILATFAAHLISCLESHAEDSRSFWLGTQLRRCLSVLTANRWSFEGHSLESIHITLSFLCLSQAHN